MKICYVLDFSVFKVDGPTINEYEFINSIEKNETIEHCYFMCLSNQGMIDETKSAAYFFNDYQQKRLLKILGNAIKVYFRFIFFYFKERPDIIVTRLGAVPVLQFLIALSHGKKLVIKTMGRFWGCAQYNTRKDKISQGVINFINKIILYHSLGIDTVTENFRNIFIKTYGVAPKKIKVIENSVNIELFYPEKISRGRFGLDLSSFFPILGYLGNQPSQRGARQLIELYGALKKTYPNMAVIIVGSDANLSSLKESINKEWLRNFFFLGEIDYQNVPEVINCFDIGYSFTTQHDLIEVGNSSQKLRQYLACGKPVITMAGTNAFVKTEELGSLVNQDDIEEIAEETIKWVKKIEQEGDALSQRLHQYAKDHLSTEQTFQQRLEFWNSLLKE